MSNHQKICECHKINWMSIVHRGEYEMTDGSPVQRGFSCADKVEPDYMTEGEYENVCSISLERKILDSHRKSCNTSSMQTLERRVKIKEMLRDLPRSHLPGGKNPGILVQ